jgi:signal transduction histidine kinase
VAVVRFLRAHVDAVVAIVLTAAYLVEVYRATEPLIGVPFITTLQVDETVAMTMGAIFLLSLAARTTYPLLPLGLAFVALAALGRGPLDSITAVALGMVLTAYSVGAWSGGRTGQLGALGVGALAGLSALRATAGTIEPRDVAAPILLLIGAWLLGLAMRSIRVDRGDERIIGELDWETGVAAPDSASRDETVRELRDVLERALSAVILQTRDARRALAADPPGAARSLGIVEVAASEALDETQRLTGQLLSPDGTPSLEPRPGLGELDDLVDQITGAGLPVAMRVEGRPLPLTPDLDAVAYRVIHEALLTTLEHAVGASSSVVVSYEPDELRIEVVDDGLGLEDDDPQEETAGLLAVRNEVASLGGSLDAGPGDDGGYWVLARLPYEPDWD